MSQGFTKVVSMFVGSLWVFIVGILTCVGDAPAYAATVAFWRFEEGTANVAASGIGSILDSSGNGLHGTPFLAPVYRSVPNQNSSLGLEFNGGGNNAQRVVVSDNPVLQLTHSLTLEAFIRNDGIPLGTQYYSQIVFRGDSRGALDPFFLALDLSGHLVFQVEDASNNQAKLTSPNPVPTGVFIHVAGTLDDATGEQKIFVNGVEVASQITSIRPFGPLEVPFNPGIGIGNVQDDFNLESFGGIIDEVRISDIALSPSEFLNAPPVGGSLTGVSPEKGTVICRNLTTRKRVKVPLDTVTIWNCEDAGLIVNPGDKIEIQLNVTGIAD